MKNSNSVVLSELLSPAVVNLDLKGADRDSVLAELVNQIPVGSSRVDLQACKLEYSIVSPK